MQRALILLAVVGLLLVGCTDEEDEAGGNGETTTPAPAGDGDAADGDAVEAAGVCDQIAPLVEIDPEVQPTQANVDLVRSAADSAPAEVAEALTLVADVGQFLADIDPADISDPAALAGIEDITTEAELGAAGSTLVAFAAEECDLEVPLFTDFAG